MAEQNNRIIRHTGIYLFADILRRSVSLIMLPIYTRYLTPADYGVVELLSMVIDLATIIFGARIAQAIFRFYCTANSVSEKRDVIGSSLFLAVLLNGIGALAVAAGADLISQFVFHDTGYSRYIILFSVIMALTPMTEIPLTYIRAQQKPWLYFSFSALRLALQLGLNIYLVVHLEMHVAGVIYSALIASAVMALLLIPYMLYKAGFSVSFSRCRSLFSFSLPIKLAAIGSFYITFGDRYILNLYTDLTQVGIYSLAYKFAFIYTILFWDTFEKAWDAEKYAIKERKDAKEIYQRVFLYISIVLIFFGLVMSLFVKDLLKIMSDPAFLDAYKVAPIIIMAYVIQSWTRYCNFSLLINNATVQFAYAEAIASAAITLAYFTLIPSYGIAGAAWATLIGFTVRFFWVYVKGRNLYDMNLPWRQVTKISVLAAGIYLPSLFISEEIYTSIFIRTLLVMLFLFAIYYLPILHRRDISGITSFMRFKF